MALTEQRFAVWLRDRRAGILHARGDYTSFVFEPDYIADPQREVLGLRFEQDLAARHSASLRLPPWFSNLLPEGQLRRWVAEQRGVSADREMQLLAEVGHDLPGAVRVMSTEESLESRDRRELSARPPTRDSSEPDWRFSLAGVQLKFSMVAKAERFTAPAVGEGGDWIVKLPDPHFANVPSNELAMMELARRAGINVPETKLVHRDALQAVPASLWPQHEAHAFAIRRFDRMRDGDRVHMEDFAQVRGFYPEDKYRGSFDTLANLIHRGHDMDSLLEFVRRLTFNVLIRNGDAHLKNWSLLYKDPRVPQLSPAYDLVATSVYATGGNGSNLGLKLRRTRRFEDVTYQTLEALERRLKVTGVSFAAVAEQVVAAALAAWPSVRHAHLPNELGDQIDRVITQGATTLARSH